MSIQKDISKLLSAGIISEETAHNIENYYLARKSSSGNRLFIVFGILGAILVGLGIILIIAHNWDNLSRAAKTGFSFLPLIIGQIWCGIYLIRKPESNTWLESSATFLFLSIGASISLISQTYHIQGDMSSYLLTWSLLAAPLLLVLRSSMVSLMLLVIITWYSNESNYQTYLGETTYHFWWMITLVVYHMYRLYRSNPKGNFMQIHHWLVPLAIIISLGSVAEKYDEVMFLSYMGLLALFYLIGNLDYFIQQKTRHNSYLVLGSLGMIIILLITSFEDFWEHFRKQSYAMESFLLSGEFITSLVLTILVIGMFIHLLSKKKLAELRPLSTTFFLFFLTFILGHFTGMAVILVNLILLFYALMTIRQGARQDHLGILNYGLLIIMSLVICRFFDSDLSFVWRGMMFVTVGIGFFLVNFFMLKKRKAHEK